MGYDVRIFIAGHEVLPYNESSLTIEGTKMSRNIDQIQEKALEAQKIIKELHALAEANDFGLDISCDGEMTFEDWQSSDCFGEGNSETFGVYADGSVWVTSSC